MIYLRIQYKFTIFDATSLWIHCLFRECTMNLRSYSRSYYEFIIYFAKVLWTHDLFRQFTINSLSFRECTMKSLSILRNHFSISRIQYELTLCFVNSLYFLRRHYELTICFANSVLINLLFRELIMNSPSISRIHYDFTMNSLGVSRIYYEFTIFFAKLLWIYMVKWIKWISSVIMVKIMISKRNHELNW